MFAFTRFRYFEVLFHIFYYYWGKEHRSLYRGLRYIDLLTSRAFEREARASERKLDARAGSYHTRPENHANDFEKVYSLYGGSLCPGSTVLHLVSYIFIKGHI